MGSPVIPEGPVTTADIYRELTALRVEITKAVTELQHTTNAGTDHEGRIRKLEQFRYIIMGIATACGTISGIVSHFISAKP